MVISHRKQIFSCLAFRALDLMQDVLQFAGDQKSPQS